MALAISTILHFPKFNNSRPQISTFLRFANRTAWNNRQIISAYASASAGDTPKYENEILRGYLRDKQSTGNPRTQNNDRGTPNSIFTNHRSTPRELDYPLKSDIIVSVVVENGEYNLKLTSVPTDNKMTQHAHTAAMLLSQGDLLIKLGQKLLTELEANHESETYKTLNL